MRLRELLQDDFHRFMYAVEATANELPPVERADVYRFAIEAVCMELVATRNTAVWRFRDDECGNMDFPIPMSVKKAECREKLTDINLKNVHVMSCPYSTQKLVKAIRDIRAGGFNKRLGEYEVNYYPEINLAITFNGLHHLAVAAIQDVAVADVYTFSLKEASEYMTTDGKCWYVKEDGYWSAYRVLDYRMALLFALYLKSIGIPYLDTEDGHEDECAYIMHSMRDEIMFMSGLRNSFCEDCPDVNTVSEVERFKERRRKYLKLSSIVKSKSDLEAAYRRLDIPYARQEWVFY